MAKAKKLNYPKVKTSPGKNQKIYDGQEHKWVLAKTRRSIWLKTKVYKSYKLLSIDPIIE